MSIITDHWDEKSNGHVVVKFRFEKTDLTSKAWYAAEGSPEVYVPTDIKTLRKTCPKCDVSNPQVFASGWMCLNSKCQSFWTLNGALAPEAQDYNPAFLEKHGIPDSLDRESLVMPWLCKSRSSLALSTATLIPRLAQSTPTKPLDPLTNFRPLTKS